MGHAVFTSDFQSRPRNGPPIVGKLSVYN